MVTAGRRKAAAVAAAAVWAFLLQGCYESLPLQQGPVPMTERIELVLNDQGRASLADRLGPQVDKVEGQMQSQDDGSYTISVFHISQLNGNRATWNGEQVNIRREHTVGFQVRRLNRTKSYVLAGVIAAATVYVFFGKSLGIAGGGVEPDPSPTPSPEQVRSGSRP